MKIFVLLVLMTGSAFASQTDFLNSDQQEYVNQYMYDICPDTYCGGDLTFDNHEVLCNKSSCRIDFSASGDSLFDVKALKKAEGIYTKSADNRNITFILNNVEATSSTASFNFSCILRGLPKTNMTIEDKTDLFYELTLEYCISEIEEIAYDY